MVPGFGYPVFVVFFIVAYTRADENSQQGSVSAQSSVSVPKSGEGQGSWQAGAYNGYYPNGYAFNSNAPYRPSNSLQNLYTYTSYLQQYIAQLQNVIQRQIEAQQHAAASEGNGAPHAGGPPNGSGVHGATAGGYVGPNGGYGSAGLLPYPTNVHGGAIPPIPPGMPGYHGVFSSASSSSSNINGEHKEAHMSTFGVDNNGQVTVFSAHNP